MPVHTKIAEQIMNEISDYVGKKEDLDSIVNLSKDKPNKLNLSVEKVEAQQGYMTLLSEGSILYGDDTIRLYIAKGTLKSWYDSIDSEFQGYVTTGHVDTNAYPVREGYFNKSDLKLVTDKNGRSDLLVKPHINLELSTIKDLIIQDEPFAISSEFLYYEMEEPDIEEYAKLVSYNIKHDGSAYVPITDKVEIKGFSFVANPGNAKSGGYEPSLLVRNEEEHLNKKETLEKVLAFLQKEVDEEVTTEEVVETETTEEVVEEAEQVEATEDDASETEDKTSDLLAKATETIESLNKEIESLKAELEVYKDNEKVVNEQFNKLEALLSKTTVKVVEGAEKKNEALTTEHGLRKRFGGDRA